MPINLNHARTALQNFDFTKLFIEGLGWSNPKSRKDAEIEVADGYTRREVAQLSGVVVIEVAPNDKSGRIPDAKTLAAIHKEITDLHYENLLIFVDAQRSQSLWYWVKREQGKSVPRNHAFMCGQSGDLFLSKISAMVFDLSDFDNAGRVPLVEVTSRLKSAMDIEKVTKKFYQEFQSQHIEFLALIEGIDDDRDRRWYASVLLNRLMFIYFLQRKFFLDGGDGDYLQHKLAASKNEGQNRFYAHFLKCLFFEGFAKPEDQRTSEALAMLGKIKYLNGGLFLPHPIEQKYANIKVSDAAFENLFALFGRYSWNLNDAIGGDDNEINPDVLGYIFEKYINQKAFGAYYTRPEITEYLCERTIHRLVLDAVNSPFKTRKYENIAELLLDLDADLCHKLLHTVLPKLALLDPACGSGAFLVAAMKTLVNLYAAIVGKIKFLNDRNLTKWLKDTERDHSSINYFIKKSIITDNLFGVDIMEEATEIARLRLFLALVAAANTVDDLEPLPNIDFNVVSGNSLIGLLQVDDEKFKKHSEKRKLFRKTYSEIVNEKNRLIHNYRHAATYADDLRTLRDSIDAKKREAMFTLNDILLDDFASLKIKFEQATWDDKKNAEGKPAKRLLSIDDIATLHPFHWGYEFDEILNSRGGFDAIITNPPWEIFKPNAKEFFEDFSDLVSKKKMTIHDFEKTQAEILADSDIRAAWLDYLSAYPHVSAFYRSAPQYQNQISIVNGKKAGSDTNLYKLFTEQCFNLLRPGGQCGIVIPSGIYTDLGTKQLRTMLFEQCQITGLFCIENRKTVFENVDSRFKFVVMTFAKGKTTETFPAAFMRHHVAELEHFPAQGAINISVDFVRRLSPDSLSVMEFKNEMDVAIAEKMLRFPLLGEDVAGAWRLVLGNEFHMTGDSHLFKISPAKGRLPLYEGKMIWQFDHRFAEPRYWVDEKEGRAAVLGRSEDVGALIGYQRYRIGHRSIASSTNERTMIAAVLPERVFFGHSINAQRNAMNHADMLFATAMLNSFVVDYALRASVTANLTMFFIYQLPIPRLTAKDKEFAPIVERAARLVCTSPEFDDLAREVGLGSHKGGASDPAERARLRAELDGMVAHLYGLSEAEFAHILGTFPIVSEEVKSAALAAYCGG